MNPLYGHWYEFTDGSVGKCEYLCECPPDQIRRDLTIGPDSLITAADVGRHACGPGEPHAMIRDNRGSGFPDAPFAGCVGCAPDGTTVAPAWAKGRGRVPYLTRWLSARECAERGLDATHPSQMSAERKPGEFKIGDRVQYKRPGGQLRIGRVMTVCDDKIWCDWANKDGSEPQFNKWAYMNDCTLIEPARDGGSGLSAQPTDAPIDGSRQSPPPARQPSDFDRLAEFFKDKRPAAVPFELGQRVEVAKVLESCPCCVGHILRKGLIDDEAKQAQRNCPECAGRGWQEVRTVR